MYSTHCPKCNVLEKKLNQNNIEYKLIEDEDVMVNKGFMTSPMLEVDGKPMDFSAAIKWLGNQDVTAPACAECSL